MYLEFFFGFAAEQFVVGLDMGVKAAGCTSERVVKLMHSHVSACKK